MSERRRKKPDLPLVKIYRTTGLFIHLLYANMEFEGTRVPEGGPELVGWLRVHGLPRGWSEKRALLYLKKHQGEFRDCLHWLCDAADYKYDADYGFGEFLPFSRVMSNPKVRFFQTHALEHAGITLAPQKQNGFEFFKLQLVQKQPQDPLDIICWAMLTLAVHHGTLFVRPCEFVNCGKFIGQVRPTKRYCNDSHRSLEHQRRKMQADPEGFRKERAKFMRKNRLDHKILQRS